MISKTSLKGLSVRLWFSMQMAFHGILSNKPRSALTVLGVAIGVTSVVALMGIGEGARLAVMKQFESLGTNVVVIQAQEDKYYFEPEKADEFLERVSTLDYTTPVIYGDAKMRWRRISAQVPILGVNQDFPVIRDHPLITGQFFNKLQVQQRSPVVVLGYNVAKNLQGQGRSIVGQSMTIGGLDYRIIGVLKEKGQGQGDGIDDKVVMPYTTAQKVLKKVKVPEIWGKSSSNDAIELSVVQLGRIIRQEYKLDGSNAVTPGGSGGGSTGGEEGGGVAIMDGGMEIPIEDGSTNNNGEEGSNNGTSLGDKKMPVTVTSLNAMVDQADQANRIMSLLLGGIAAVSLLVGGLGIMNIMLVAVTERTGEIGVRRALGARQSDLMVQFVLEALYLSGIGAVIGVILGVLGLNMFAHYGFDTAVSFTAIRVAVLVALGSGLVFGVYPAANAASIPPVEALRRD